MAKILRAVKLPRMRQRSRRRSPIRRLILVVTIIAIPVYIVGWSSILSVKAVTFTGTSQNDLVAEQVKSRAPELRLGAPMARLNLTTITNELSSISWIAKSKISRNWITRSVKVSLTPRIPIAVINSTDSQVKYLDATGYQFSDPKPYVGLPQVTLGLENAKARLALSKFLSVVPAELLSSMRSLSVGGGNQITMETDFEGKSLTINWGTSNSATQIKAKMQVLRSLIAMPENAKISSVDLSNSQAPVVK